MGADRQRERGEVGEEDEGEPGQGETAAASEPR